MERRAPDRQEPRLNGRRATDPTMTTRQCADSIGVSPGFVVGEIRDGRLRALVIKRPRRRSVYRVAPADWAAYVRQHWNMHVA